MLNSGKTSEQLRADVGTIIENSRVRIQDLHALRQLKKYIFLLTSGSGGGPDGRTGRDLFCACWAWHNYGAISGRIYGTIYGTINVPSPANQKMIPARPQLGVVPNLQTGWRQAKESKRARERVGRCCSRTFALLCFALPCFALLCFCFCFSFAFALDFALALALAFALALEL